MHRVTDWRRRKRIQTGNATVSKYGRRPISKSGDTDPRLFWVVNAIDEFRKTNRIDPISISKKRPKTAFGKRLLKNMVQSEMPSTLLITVAWDYMRCGTRRRVSKITKEDKDKILSKLCKGYSSSEKVEIEREYRKNPSAEWIAKVLAEDPVAPVITPSVKPECPSKFFPGLSRRMISYWRRKSETTYEAEVFLRGLIYPPTEFKLPSCPS